MRTQRRAPEARGRKAALAMALATAVTVAVPPMASAAEEMPAFGMIGLARRQVAILNLVLVQPPDPDQPGCRVTASFVDARGQVFRDGAGRLVQETFVLRPQVAAELRLRSEDILGPREVRKSIRAALSSPADDGSPSDCGCLVTNWEIVGASGRTSLSDAGARPPGGGNPPPPPICLQLAR